MSKTIPQILAEVNQFKPCCQRQLMRYMKALDIKFLGCRQKPNKYPDDTADRIRSYLGITVPEPERQRRIRMTEIITVKEAKRRAGKGKQ